MYDVLIDDADNLRNKKKTASAIVYYQTALKLRGDRDRYCKQMIGVCYKMSGDLDLAIAWLGKAAIGASPYERGNIMRDLADCYRLKLDFLAAFKAIEISLDLFPREQFPQEWAMGVGFKARILEDTFEWTRALQHYELAHETLSGPPKLFNVVYYASFLCKIRSRSDRKPLLKEARQLAREHGSKHHRLRIFAIRWGGYYPDAWLQSLRRRLHH